jgi:hypothetical protein
MSEGQTLTRVGTVSVADQVARLIRLGLVEEYSVSMDGVRQDFVVTEKPPGDEELQVRLEVTGARVEPLATGARLVLEGSGPKIAYSHLRATDATGRELPARIEVLTTNSESRKQKAEMALVVEDARAVYPVRIDPTFSDENWISLNPSIPGADGAVNAAVVDGAGNVHIGGDFTAVGDVMANRVAKWNGSSWSALGSGMGGGDTHPGVVALAVSGSDLYAGGDFTTAGGGAANGIAKWNGSSWSAVGSGMGGGLYHLTTAVFALAVSGTNLYAGGNFTTAGGSAATNIAKWNGSSWSALGSGMNDYVMALAVSGSDVDAGGYFTTVGGSAANYIAKWDGSGWSALGGGGTCPGMFALAVSGSDVDAGGSAANCIAKWDGSSWSALGSGMGGGDTHPGVFALAVSGSDVYAGGDFTTAGGSAANHIAKWDGSSWSALGSGMNGEVVALAVSGSGLYASGGFTTAGGRFSPQVAEAVFVMPSPVVLESPTLAGGVFSASFTNTPGATLTGRGTTNLSLPLATWPVAGSVTEVSPGQFQITAPQATNSPQRYYRIRWP